MFACRLTTFLWFIKQGGTAKRDAVRALLAACAPDPAVPASILLAHANAVCLIDESAFPALEADV